VTPIESHAIKTSLRIDLVQITACSNDDHSLEYKVFLGSLNPVVPLPVVARGLFSIVYHGCKDPGVKGSLMLERECCWK
jgi:hypothetical protein